MITTRTFTDILLLVWLLTILRNECVTAAAADTTSCTNVYLAPSSVSNAGGWGVFAAQDYQVGDVIGPSSLAIPFIDRNNNNNNNNNVLQPQQLSEYLWETANLGGFSLAQQTQLFVPGLLSNINHHSVLDNVIPVATGPVEMDWMEDSASLHHIRLIASRDIETNEELFIDYNGAHFTADHPYLASNKLFPDLYGKDNHTAKKVTTVSDTCKGLPLAEDYQQADDIVDGLWNLHETLLQEHQQSFTTAQWMDILYRIRQTRELLILDDDDDDNEEDDDDDSDDDRRSHVVSLLPRNFDELQQTVQLGGVAEFEIAMNTRKEQPVCLDTVQDSRSSKAFRKGDVVAVSPLVVTTKDAMHIVSDTNATTQILQKFCFGHRHSELLFCPTTNVATIRHHAGRSKGMANVKIQWDMESITGTADVLASPLQDFLNQMNDTAMHTSPTLTSKRLAFQYVALRDIAKGEQLWMDFGVEYQNALDQYSKKRKLQVETRQSHPEDIVLSADLPYFYQYECNLYPNMKVQAGQEYRSWEDFFSNRMMNRQNWPNHFAMLYQKNEYASWYPCNVVDSQSDGHFDIEVYHKGYQSDYHGSDEDDDKIIRRLYNCPKDRIRFVEAPYQSLPLFDPLAFRRYIPISDDIFPLHWRHDYKPSSYWNIGAVAESSKSFDYERTLREVKCGLYLAKSNIPNAGFGLYTAVDIPAADIVIGSSLPAIVVHEPIGVDAWYNGWVGKDYVWGGDSFWMMFDGYPDFQVHIVNGLFGAMSNFHTGLVNMEIHTARMHPLLDRRLDCGAGGFSDLVNSAFTSKFPINAGEELFISYGEHWLEYREAFNDVPLSENFDESDQIAASVWSMLHLEGASIPNTTVAPFLRTIQDVLVSEHRTKMALNNVLDLHSLKRLVERNGTAKMTVNARSNDWLEDNGFCLDNFYVKDSTIRQAGKGAFARRPMKSGSIVHSSPVIAASRSHMDLTNTTKLAEINLMQLMLNYNFGHANSSILFLPLTQMIAINHNSGRMEGGQAPNARVTFSKTNDPKTRYLLNRPLQDIYAEKYSALLLDIIATRDINPDEEIFIDYGEAWEHAWHKHVREWRSPCESKTDEMCFESSRLVDIEMNRDRHNPKYHAWSDLHLSACQSNASHPWEQGEVVYLVDSELTEKFGSDDSTIHKEFLGFTANDNGFEFPYLSLLNPRPCKILHSNDESDTFDVVYFFQPYQIPLKHRNSNAPDARAVVRFKGLPAHDLRFINKPLKGDSHWPGAFRHEIAIPDSEFPVLWRDLQKAHE